MKPINEFNQILPLVFKAVGLAMAVAAVVLSVLKAAPVETITLLLGMGLFSLAMNALQKEEDHE